MYIKWLHAVCEDKIFIVAATMNALALLPSEVGAHWGYK